MPAKKPTKSDLRSEGYYVHRDEGGAVWVTCHANVTLRTQEATDTQPEVWELERVVTKWRAYSVSEDCFRLIGGAWDGSEILLRKSKEESCHVRGLTTRYYYTGVSAQGGALAVEVSLLGNQVGEQTRTPIPPPVCKERVRVNVGLAQWERLTKKGWVRA